MSPEYMKGRRSDRLPNVTDMWFEGRLPPPSMNLMAALESSFDVVFALFGIGRNATPSGSVINKLSGKALAVEDSLTNQGARIEQITRSDAPNQRWSIKYVKVKWAPHQSRGDSERGAPILAAYAFASTGRLLDHRGSQWAMFGCPERVPG
jgi:hypothetical protein